MVASIQSIKGMKDALPADMGPWLQLEAALAQLANQYGYKEVRFPLLEQTGLFKRAIGDITDIVEKEMYTFTDKNNDSITLRPEGTAPCVRMMMQAGLLREKGHKVWYMGPMFRRERPQKGRLRQFHQFGVEAFGMEGPDIDIEQIAMMARLLKNLNIKDNITLEINSLGTLPEREAYKTELVKYLSANKDKLDEDSLRRLESNPLRILDSKNPHMHDLISSAPKLIEHLNSDSLGFFNNLKSGLESLGIQYSVNPCMVRGLDYYGHTVYEWVSSDLGAQGTICAGGRYNALVEQLGGQSTPAVGFAAGIERILLLLEQQQAAKLPDIDVYCIAVGENASQHALKLAENLRDRLPKLRLQVHCGGGSFKSQFKRADKSGAKYALILGDDECASGKYGLKSLRDDAGQENLGIDELVTELAKQG